MAKQPRFTLQDVPSSGGPMAPLVRNAGAVGQAVAGVGQIVQRRGEFLTAQAREAEERTKRLQQATQVSQFGLEAVNDWNKLQSDLATEQNPDARHPRYEEVESRIRGRLETIQDPDVRAQAETWLNGESAIWDGDIRTGTQKLRIKQANDHLAALGQDAIRRRDISQIQTYADALVDGGFFSKQERNDLVTQYDATIQGELVKDAITGTTLSLGSHSDQVAYLKGLSRPQALTDQEWADFRDGLFAKLDVERATAAQQERLLAAAVEGNDRKILADAWRGSLDVEGALKMMEDGQASASVVSQAVSMAKKGPTAVDDADTVMAAERWLTRIRREPGQKEKGLAWLKDNATKLTATKWEGYVAAYEKAGDPADPLSDPQYKLLDGLLEENFFADKEGQLVFGPYTGREAERAYIDAKERLRRFRTAKPEATDDDLQAEYERLVAVPQQVAVQSKIWDWIKLSTPGYGPGLRFRRWLYGSDEAQPQAAPVDLDAEPLSQREFEDAVKLFPAGSKEQTAYYNRWAGKWQ